MVWSTPTVCFSVVSLWLSSSPFFISAELFDTWPPSSFFFFHMFFFLSPNSSLGQPSLLKEGSLSDTVAPEKKISATCTPPGIRSGATVQPSAQDKRITLEVVTLVPPPQRLFAAEIPLWKVLEGRSGEDTPEKISAKEGTKPLCRG